MILRTAKGITQAQLARKLGTQREAIARWERDDYTGYTLENLQKIVFAVLCLFPGACRPGPGLRLAQDVLGFAMKVLHLRVEPTAPVGSHETGRQLFADLLHLR